MKFSTKVEKCGLSPMRKFHPYAVAAQEKGKKIYHLNIGQPDIETPKAYFDAVKHFDQPVLEYAPSPGMPVLTFPCSGTRNHRYIRCPEHPEPWYQWSHKS